LKSIFVDDPMQSNHQQNAFQHMSLPLTNERMEPISSLLQAD
jgi:hypothetical protein